MKNILKLSLAFILILGLSTGCKKYVDGPKISLLTKKARLCGKWKIQFVSFNDADITSASQTLYGSGYVLEIDKNKTYKTTGGTVTDSGKWELGEDKDDVYFTSDTPGSVEQAYRILRLKSKELWLRFTAFNGDKTIIHYVPA